MSQICRAKVDDGKSDNTLDKSTTDTYIGSDHGSDYTASYGLPRTAHGPKKQVGFANVECREHGMVLGDNPSCSWGPPVSLGWEVSRSYVMTLDDFEKCRVDDGCPRRKKDEMILPRHIRERILFEHGYSLSAQRTASVRNSLVQRQRMKTARRSKSLSWLEEKFEPVAKKFSR